MDTAEALNGAGPAAQALGDDEHAETWLHESLRLSSIHRNPLFTYRTLQPPGLVAQARGDYDQARSLFQRALALEQAAGDGFSRAMTLRCLAGLERVRGHSARG